MAKVTANKPVERMIHIEMPESEASFLLALIRRVGGEPSGPRGIFSGNPNSLLEQLCNLKVRAAEVDMRIVEGYNGNNLFFE